MIEVRDVGLSAFRARSLDWNYSIDDGTARSGAAT